MHTGAMFIRKFQALDVPRFRAGVARGVDGSGQMPPRGEPLTVGRPLVGALSKQGRLRRPTMRSGFCVRPGSAREERASADRRRSYHSNACEGSGYDGERRVGGAPLGGRFKSGWR
jgi:hypothetical protein